MTLQNFTDQKKSSEIEELETREQKTIKKLRERAKNAEFAGEIKQ